MKTIQQFMTENQIYIEFKHMPERPDRFMADMPQGTRHFKAVVCYRNKPSKWFSTFYSIGPALNYPNAYNCFSCLISDAQAGTMDAFEFMAEFGYEDIYEARKIHAACVKQYEKMLAFLGPELLEEAMYELEGL